MNRNGVGDAIVLATLYNASKPQGLGMPQFKREEMTMLEAGEILKHFKPGQKKYFDYLRGRVMKIDVGANPLDFRLYDRDNGLGAGAAALKEAVDDKSDPFES